jgi:hypothetical protein
LPSKDTGLPAVSATAPALNLAEKAVAARLARSAVIALTSLLGFTACRQDMHNQPKYVPFRESTFFADGASARQPVEGTVARGQLREDTLLHTGLVGGQDATVFPFPVDDRVMARGQERYDIYCSPCHARTGLGDGLVVLRGYRRPPPLQDERLRNVAYIRALQLSGYATIADVPPDQRGALQ